MIHRRVRVVVASCLLLSPLSASPLVFDDPDPDLSLWDAASQTWVQGPLTTARLRMKIVAEEGAWVTVMPFAYLKDRSGNHAFELQVLKNEFPLVLDEPTPYLFTALGATYDTVLPYLMIDGMMKAAYDPADTTHDPDDVKYAFQPMLADGEGGDDDQVPRTWTATPGNWVDHDSSTALAWRRMIARAPVDARDIDTGTLLENAIDAQLGDQADKFLTKSGPYGSWLELAKTVGIEIALQVVTLRSTDPAFAPGSSDATAPGLAGVDHLAPKWKRTPPRIVVVSVLGPSGVPEIDHNGVIAFVQPPARHVGEQVTLNVMRSFNSPKALIRDSAGALRWVNLKVEGLMQRSFTIPPGTALGMGQAITFRSGNEFSQPSGPNDFWTYFNVVP